MTFQNKLQSQQSNSFLGGLGGLGSIGGLGGALGGYPTEGTTGAPIAITTTIPFSPEPVQWYYPGKIIDTLNEWDTIQDQLEVEKKKIQKFKEKEEAKKKQDKENYEKLKQLALGGPKTQPYIAPDGTMIFPNGIIIKPDGTIINTATGSKTSKTASTGKDTSSTETIIIEVEVQEPPKKGRKFRKD